MVLDIGVITATLFTQIELKDRPFIAEEPRLTTHSEVFMNVFLGESPDAAKSWYRNETLKEADGKAVLFFSETNGDLVETPDGEVVIVCQRRDPRYLPQTLARVSTDQGKTWGQEALLGTRDPHF